MTGELRGREMQGTILLLRESFTYTTNRYSPSAIPVPRPALVARSWLSTIGDLSSLPYHTIPYLTYGHVMSVQPRDRAGQESFVARLMPSRLDLWVDTG